MKLRNGWLAQDGAKSSNLFTTSGLAMCQQRPFVPCPVETTLSWTHNMLGWSRTTHRRPSIHPACRSRGGGSWAEVVDGRAELLLVRGHDAWVPFRQPAEALGDPHRRGGACAPGGGKRTIAVPTASVSFVEQLIISVWAVVLALP